MLDSASGDYLQENIRNAFSRQKAELQAKARRRLAEQPSNASGAV